MSVSADRTVGLAQSRPVEEEDIVLEEVVAHDVKTLSPVASPRESRRAVHISQFPAPPEFDAQGRDHIETMPYPSPQCVQYARVYEQPGTFYDHSP